MKRTDQDTRERHRDRTSKGRMRWAEQHRCPECKRGGAITRHELDPWTVIKKCRYCTYEQGVKIERKSDLG